MLRALVIGCGSIGAAYDLHSDDVLTHAKAFALHPEIEFQVADIDHSKAEEVARRYGVEVFDLSDSTHDFADFDIVSVCVGTRLHIGYLQQLLQSPRPFVICEKPVVATLEEIKLLRELKPPAGRILVNYIRRFQPGFSDLKQKLQKLLNRDKEVIRHVEIRYQRGFLNNGSHALDLLSFLPDLAPVINDLKVLRYAFDVFPEDPTASLHFSFGGIRVFAVGFEDPSYTIFEIDIYTSNTHVSVSESGNLIRCFHREQNSSRLELMEPEVQKDVIKDYMKPVVDTAIACMQGRKETNFAEALSLNEAILNTISLISKEHGQTGT